MTTIDFKFKPGDMIQIDGMTVIQHGEIIRMAVSRGFSPTSEAADFTLCKKFKYIGLLTSGFNRIFVTNDEDFFVNTRFLTIDEMFDQMITNLDLENTGKFAPGDEMFICSSCKRRRFNGAEGVKICRECSTPELPTSITYAELDEQGMVIVTGLALLEILNALNDPSGIQIRELRALRHFDDNAINTVIAEFNECIKAAQKRRDLNNGK